MNLAGQRRLKNKRRHCLNQCVNSLQHQPASRDRLASWIERRESYSNQICVDEFPTINESRQERSGKRRFAGNTWACVLINGGLLEFD